VVMVMTNSVAGKQIRRRKHQGPRGKGLFKASSKSYSYSLLGLEIFSKTRVMVTPRLMRYVTCGFRRT
jgi:hypothetical protein